MQEIETGLGDIARAALARRDLSALEEMLCSVATTCGGFGAVLWQVRIEGELAESDPLNTFSKPVNAEGFSDLPMNRMKLFVLAHGFEDKSILCRHHGLSLDHPSGRALVQGDYESPNCAEDNFVDRESELYRTAEPGSLYAIRLTFKDGTIGALTVYFHETGGLSEVNKAKVHHIVEHHLPAFYLTILDRVGYRLLKETSDYLDRAEADRPNAVMEKIAASVAEILDCREVSVFLEDRHAQIDEFRCEATTCEKLVLQESFSLADNDLTALVARERRPLLILDIRSIPSYLIEKTQLIQINQLISQVDSSLGMGNPEIAPISFAAVPVVAGGRTVGVLRCQLRPKTPHYFSEADVNLMVSVAARIGSFWNRHMRQRENEIINDLWETFVDELNQLEMHLRDLTTKAKRPQVNRRFQDEIFSQGLLALRKSIRGADILDVALVNSDRRFIETFVLLDSSLENTPSKQRELRKRLPLHPDSDNSWAYIFHHYKEQKSFLIKDCLHPSIPYKDIYPEIRQALFSPIIADNECIGILSIRSKSFFRDVEKATRMASLVALQVGLYHQLTTVLSQQARTYQDLAHQLRTPVFQARKRLRWLVEKTPKLTSDLQAINGLVTKTQRVLSNMQLYEDLALDRPISARKDEYSIDSLTKMIIQACADNQVLWSSRNIAFILDRDSFNRVRPRETKYDAALLEQVINNLLDNAGKYSQPGTQVTITANVEATNKRLEIVVKNKAGIRIDKGDVSRFGERGFRSEMAKRRTAEGSGIGLFLVRQIVLAHDGDLKVTETDFAGFNEVAFWIPV